MVTFLELGRYGRLCNQMFQIAGTIGMAKKFGYDFAFPYWKNYDHAERFKSSEDIDIQSYFENPLPLLEHTNFTKFKVPWGYHQLKILDNVSLHGHMQSEKYFMHCHKLVRHYFKMKNLSNIKIEKKSIAVHFRGGDYGDDYHPRMTMRYYENALRNLPSDHKIYIFSDEIKTCRQMFGSNVEYVETDHYMKDLFLMQQCHHFVISNSTFAWWGAWLGLQPAKQVVAPAIWFGPAAKKLQTKDIYCFGWKIV